MLPKYVVDLEIDLFIYSRYLFVVVVCSMLEGQNTEKNWNHLNNWKYII